MTIQENIQKIRLELLAFVQNCIANSTQLIEQLEALTDDEVMTLYVQHTFDVDWRGELLESLATDSIQMSC